MLIEVSGADLAGCRYAISPLAETTSALRVLAGHLPAGVLRPWVDRMRPRLAALRRAEPAVGALISLHRRDDNADFLHPPPPGPRGSIADELATVRATPLDRARAELARNLAGHREPPGYARQILNAPDVIDRLADGLYAAWSALIEPEWARLRAVLERDIVQRAGRLAAFGWGSALADLHPRVSWSAPGTITVRHRDTATYSLDGRGLLFVPSVFADLVLGAAPPRPFELVDRARGVADIFGPPAVIGAGPLAPLIGGARAAILRALAAPGHHQPAGRATRHESGQRRRPPGRAPRRRPDRPGAFGAIGELRRDTPRRRSTLGRCDTVSFATTAW